MNIKCHERRSIKYNGKNWQRKTDGEPLLTITLEKNKTNKLYKKNPSIKHFTISFSYLNKMQKTGIMILDISYGEDAILILLIFCLNKS